MKDITVFRIMACCVGATAGGIVGHFFGWIGAFFAGVFIGVVSQAAWDRSEPTR